MLYFLDQDLSPIFADVQILYLGLDQEWMLISLINIYIYIFLKQAYVSIPN